MNVYYVYMYLREEDTKNGPIGSPYYIGKGKNNRAYSKHRVRLPKDKKNIIFIQKEMTNEDACKLEIELIASHGRLDKQTGYLANLTDGGESTVGWICSEETKAKISKAHKGKCHISLEGLAKHSERMKGERNPFYNKTHSKETRLKMSVRQKGKPKDKPFTEQHKANISKARIGIIPWNKGKIGVQDYSKQRTAKILI
jgi:hypothetical protein